MAQQNSILKVRNLNKIFTQKGTALVAVDNVSFDVAPGESIGLIGESGSGKTTIGRTILKLHNATSGQVILKGHDVASQRLTRNQKKLLRENIQMIFQDPYSSLNEQKNIMHIVSEPLKILKHGKQLMKNLYRNHQEVGKYFHLTIKKEIKKELGEFTIYSNKVAINFYKKIIRNLQNFETNGKTKIEDCNSLFSQYYGLKHEANTLINDKLLSIGPNIFKMWTHLQNKVDKRMFEYDEEKQELEASINLEQAKIAFQFSPTYLKTKKQVQGIERTFNKFRQFMQSAINESKNILINLEKEWETTVKLTKQKRAYTETSSAYNIMTIEYWLAKYTLNVIDDILHHQSVKIVTKSFSHNIKKMYDLCKSLGFEWMKEKVLKSSSNFKMFTEQLNNNPQVLAAQETLKLNDSTSNMKEIMIILFKIFAKKHDLNINSYKELKKLLHEKKKALHMAASDWVQYGDKKNIKDAKKALQVAKKNLVNVYQKTDEAYKAEHKAAFVERDKIIQEQNEILELQRKQADLLFEQRLNQVWSNYKPNSKGPGIVQSNFHFKKWIKKNIAKYEQENKALEQSIKRNKKVVNTLEKFTTKKGNGLFLKRKIKELLITNRVYEVLEAAGLTKAHAYRYPHEFSGGMRQRVGIARAIIARPKIIIADEPIAALDLSIQAQIVNLLKKFQRNEKLSMIFIAHDLSMVKYISDRLLIIHLGKIVEYGPTNKIFKNPVHPYTKNLIASMPDIKKISKGFAVDNFAPKYLANYSALNKPTYHQVQKDHFVLGDQAQIKLWKK